MGDSVKASSKKLARQRLRERHAEAAAARERRERANLTDLAEFLHQQERATEVDDWLRRQVEKANAEAQRRRSRHQVAAGVALRRVRDRGESVATIAEQAGVSTSTVSRFLKAAEGVVDVAVAARDGDDDGDDRVAGQGDGQAHQQFGSTPVGDRYAFDAGRR